MVDAVDINNDGVVFGESGTLFDRFLATWTASGGVASVPAVTQEARAVAINDLGQLAGTTVTPTLATGEAFIITNGVVQFLGFANGDTRSESVGLTESGAVGVESGNLGTNGSVRGVSDFFFRDSSGVFGQFASGLSAVFGVNDAFQYVGLDNSGSAMFFDGTVHNLLDTPPGAAGPNARGRALAINNSELVVGFTSSPSGFGSDNFQAVYWQGTSPGIAVPVADSEANGVNEFGVIVGRGGLLDAFRVRPGRSMQRLADLATVPANINFLEAKAVNELGQIVGRFTRVDGSLGAFLLDPVELGSRFALANTNSTGQAASIRAIGSARAGSRSMFTLQATEVPEAVGVFAVGVAQAPVPLDAGFLALAAPLTLSLPFDQARNVANLDLSLPSAVAGLTLSFQYFFVDNPVNNELNSTDGITVTFSN